MEAVPSATGARFERSRAATQEKSLQPGASASWKTALNEVVATMRCSASPSRDAGGEELQAATRTRRTPQIKRPTIMGIPFRPPGLAIEDGDAIRKSQASKTLQTEPSLLLRTQPKGQ